MSLKAELSDLLDAATDKIRAADHVAVSERNRVHDAVQGAQSAVASMIEPAPAEPEPEAVAEPAPAPAPVVEAPATEPVAEPAPSPEPPAA